MQKVLGNEIRRTIGIICVIVDIQNRFFLAIPHILDDSPRIPELASVNKNNIWINFSKLVKEGRKCFELIRDASARFCSNTDNVYITFNRIPNGSHFEFSAFSKLPIRDKNSNIKA